MLDLSRLVVLAALVNIQYFIEKYLLADNTGDVKQEEKRILRDVCGWAKSHNSRIKRNNNPHVKSLYQQLEDNIPFVQNMMTIAFTVNEPHRDRYIQHCARLSNWFNAKTKGFVEEHPDWLYYGESDNEIEITEDNVTTSTKLIPRNEEMCVIKTQRDGIPIITYYDHVLLSFIDPFTNVQYYGNMIYKWRSID